MQSLEPGMIVDLYYRNGDHSAVIRRAIIRGRDDHGVMIFGQVTQDHQWVPYAAIIRMIIAEPSEADMIN